jgi:hypothetical protein
MIDRSTLKLTRRQFLGAAASVGAWSTLGSRLPVGAVFAPAFFNCNEPFFAQLTTLLARKRDLRVTLFLTVAELPNLAFLTNSQIDIGFRPNSPTVHLDYAQWRGYRQKPLVATVEQGAQWSKLATLCARESILLASWDYVSRGFSAENFTPLFDGSAVDLAELFVDVNRSVFLLGNISQRITPLHALA